MSNPAASGGAPEIWFHSKDAETGWLSNLSRHGFTLSKTRWPSVEHYYQAQKYAADPIANRIRAAATPLQARKIGQDRSLAARADWEDVREAAMAVAVRAKFVQNRALGAQLLATRDARLIHFSNSDAFWGRTREGTGANRLGEILMAVREELRADGTVA